MVMFILSSLFLIAAAFIIGAILGNLAKSLSPKSNSVSESSTRAADARLSSLPLLGTPANDDVRKSAKEAAAMIPPAEPIPAPDPARSGRGPRTAAKTAAPTARARPAAKAVRNPRQDDKNRPSLLKAARRGRPDKLTQINGIGTIIQSKLFTLGIYHHDQIAAWTADEAAWISEELGFPGRAQREDWVKQASDLMKAKAKPKAASNKAAPRPARTGKNG
ncbi:hypothetical protein [Phyllobacterium endophyticum]|uniref:hypothetical protein n=1 Tax=Phyllobacterium endophyticum TaxID=1149773 RepID=UPI0011C80DBC|nr:hypothetical protein [Phyllobacterium endophyticum]TXR46900.1 hypothetical protein FVA77_22670 [Phyllobacterium endophyticum]